MFKLGDMPEKQPRGPCLCSKDCTTHCQMLQLTTRGQNEHDDLHEVRGALDNKAMKTHQTVARTQCHTPQVIYCHDIKIPSMQTVSFAECSWSSALRLQNIMYSALCMVIRPWQHEKCHNMCKTIWAATCVCHVSMAACRCHRICGS